MIHPIANNTKCTVHSLGDDLTYPGVIKGIAERLAVPSYIVEMNYPGTSYSCRVITAACISVP